MPASTPVRRARTKPATTGRTTPKKPRKTPGIYTDKDGDKFRLSGKINTFLLLKIQADSEDGEFNGADMYRLIIGMVVDADRKLFISKLSRNADMDAEALNDVMTEMLEVASGRNPSSSPSASGGTARQNTSRALSAAK